MPRGFILLHQLTRHSQGRGADRSHGVLTYNFTLENWILLSELIPKCDSAFLHISHPYSKLCLVKNKEEEQKPNSCGCNAVNFKTLSKNMLNFRFPMHIYFSLHVPLYYNVLSNYRTLLYIFHLTTISVRIKFSFFFTF